MAGEQTVKIVLTPRQGRLLKHAATAAGRPLADYLVDNACVAAYRLLMDKPEFLLDDPDWEHFLALLDQPASEIPTLKGLLRADG